VVANRVTERMNRGHDPRQPGLRPWSEAGNPLRFPRTSNGEGA